MLAQFYTQMKQANQKFEVVFVSADKDMGSFEQYLKGTRITNANIARFRGFQLVLAPTLTS